MLPLRVIALITVVAGLPVVVACSSHDSDESNVGKIHVPAGMEQFRAEACARSAISRLDRIPATCASCAGVECCEAVGDFKGESCAHCVDNCAGNGDPVTCQARCCDAIMRPASDLYACIARASQGVCATACAGFSAVPPPVADASAGN